MTEEEKQITDQPDYLVAIEHIRKRPGMYIGGTDLRALHWMLNNCFNYFAREAFAGRYSHIWLTLHKDGSVTIRGSNMNSFSKENKASPRLSLFELLLLFRDRDFIDFYGPGLWGMECFITNAFSSSLEVEVYQAGCVQQQSFCRGIPQSDMEEVRKLLPDEPESATVTFTPDPEIFPSIDFNYDLLAGSLEEQAYLIPGLSVTLRDERNSRYPIENQFCFENGMVSYLERLNTGIYPVRSPVIHGQKDIQFRVEKKLLNTHIEFAFRYGLGFVTNFNVSFVNGFKTMDGGSHVEGVVAAVRDVIKGYAKKKKNSDGKKITVTADKVRRHLALIVHVVHPDPRFGGNMMRVLASPEIQAATYDLTTEVFTQFLGQNRKEVEHLLWLFKRTEK